MDIPRAPRVPARILEVMQSPVVIGKHVYLRPLHRADAARTVPWVNDPEVTRSVTLHRPMNVESQEEFVTRPASPSDVIFGIATKDPDVLIGTTGLHRIDARDRKAIYGIVIGDKSAWGKGYGTEVTGLMLEYAFLTLNMNRVALEVIEFNERGIRCYEKVGFSREGVLRHDAYREGRYWDTIVMGILRTEWDARRAAG